MAKLTLAGDEHAMATWGGIFLDHTLAKALNIFLNAPRSERSKTEWHAKCMAGQSALVFFQGTRASDVFRLTASKIAADAYEELRDQKEVAIIKPALVVKLRGQANSMRASLPVAQHLPGPANTKEFRTGLDSLCRWTTPVTAPTSKSGDTCARAFTLALAQKFATAFVDIPVEYVHSLVRLGWPNRSVSATWRILTANVTERIKQEAEGLRLQESLAHDTTVLALQAASATRHVMTESESQAADQLRDELERLRRGKRRFSSDAARLRALREIAQSLDDTELADELSLMIESRLQDFLS